MGALTSKEGTKQDTAKAIADTTADTTADTKEENTTNSKKSFLNIFSKGPTDNTKFTEDFGKFYFVSFLSAIYCRMTYLTPREYLNAYTQIFGEGKIIQADLMSHINDAIKQEMNQGINALGNSVLIDDKKMFDLNLETTDKYGIKVIKHKDGELYLQFLEQAQEINKVLAEQRNGNDAKSCFVNKADDPTANPNLVFVNISGSNYGDIYIVGDKRAPNIVNVTFRGTSNLQSMASYVSVRTVAGPTTILIWKKPDGTPIKIQVLNGIYEILNEVINLIMNAVDYVAKTCNGKEIKDTLEANSIKIITTGHSLGGALATLFAFKYILFPKYRQGKEYLDKDICCMSLGSPKVLGVEAAAVFCCLIKQNEGEIQNLKAKEEKKPNKVITDILKTIPNYDTIGRITYLRITTYNDPVPLLPLLYRHPCSYSDAKEFETIYSRDEKIRQNMKQDCLVLVEDPFNTGCLLATKSPKLVHVNNYTQPLKCMNDEREFSVKSSKTGKFFINRSVYHTQYLGISFAGALTFPSFPGRLFKGIGREPLVSYGTKTTDQLVNIEKINNTQRDDTIERLIFYPNLSEQTGKSASMFYYDLAVYRDKVSNDLQEEKAREAAEEKNETPFDTTKTIEAEEKKEEEEEENVPAKQLGILFKDKIGETPEDIYFTKDVFNGIIEFIKNPPEFIIDINNACNTKQTEDPADVQENTVIPATCDDVLNKVRNGVTDSKGIIKTFLDEYNDKPIYIKMNLYYGLNYDIIKTKLPPKETPVGKNILNAFKLQTFREKNKIEASEALAKTTALVAKEAVKEEKAEINALETDIDLLKTQLAEGQNVVGAPPEDINKLKELIDAKEKEIQGKETIEDQLETVEVNAEKEEKRLEQTEEKLNNALASSEPIIITSLATTMPIISSTQQSNVISQQQQPVTVGGTRKKTHKTKKRKTKKRKTKRANKQKKSKSKKRTRKPVKHKKCKRTLKH